MRRAAILATIPVLALVACGKKGPPLPPLVKLPAAPADFAAERRGDTVDLQFTVPAANTDNTRPANLSRVDVYAITSRDPVPPDDIVRRGSRVGTVAVKSPRDPENTIEEDEPSAGMEPPEGDGLDQGAGARLAEKLEPAALVPIAPARKKGDSPSTGDQTTALLPPAASAPLTRTYVAVGLSTRDRKGPFSRPVHVPLVAPPSPPARPAVTYDERAIKVVWQPVAGRAPIQRPREDDELPSTAIGAPPATIAYNVYDATSETGPVRLTKTPTTEASFSDARIVWGERRCYVVRTVETINDLPIESDAPDPVCTTLEDTFAPAAPANLQSSPLEGAINLIWDASPEKDLAGYIVLRGTSADAMTPITPDPIQVTTFLDQVQPGVRYTYAVKAVDKAGNASPPSRTVEEAARE